MDSVKGIYNRIDELVEQVLRRFAKTTLQERWYGKEHDWVNRFVHGTLVKHCNPAGPLYDVGQVGIEVAVPQPKGFKKAAVRRDVVIWEHPGSTCWNSQWKPVNHPLAIMEWKVHRPGHQNRKVHQEREWLRQYCAWQPSVVAYAVEIDTTAPPFVLKCARFQGRLEDKSWLLLKSGN